jgi:hypothetical protein
VAGFSSEWWPTSNRNAGRDQIGIPGRIASEFAFGHDLVILHENEMVKKKRPFSFLQYDNLRNRFMGELSEIIREAPMIVITAAIPQGGAETALYEAGKSLSVGPVVLP